MDTPTKINKELRMKQKQCEYCKRVIKKGTEAYYNGDPVHRKCYGIYKYQKLHPNPKTTFLDTIKMPKEKK